MRSQRFFRDSLLVLLIGLTLSGCSLFKQSHSKNSGDSPSTSSSASASLPEPSASVSAKPTQPALTASASQIACQDGSGHLMWQANQIVNGEPLKIADLQCESGGPKFGQVIESFSLAEGKWVSQGLVSGPDLAFRTIGECIDDLVSKISCPAQALSEDGSQLDGTLLITLERENASWQFTAN